MALDYYLSLRNDDESFDTSRFHSRLLTANSIVGLPGDDSFNQEGLSINVTIDDDEPSAFGGRFPDVCVAFRLNKFDLMELGIHKMLTVVGWVSQTTDADFQMTFNADEILLQRRNMKISLFATNDFWTDSRILEFKHCLNVVELNPELDTGSD